MASPSDPTEPIREQASTFPAVAKGTSCNQSSFKAGKGSFLFIGPGAKGQGYKAMFKLDASLPEARDLAAREPERFDVGNTGWVTARFTAEKPLPKRVWQKWLRESYELMAGAKPAKGTTQKGATQKGTTQKGGAKKTATKKKSTKKKAPEKG